MPIVDLIVAVCMIGDPQKCHDEHFYFEAGNSLRECMFRAMPEVAKWSGDHPQWHVAGFHCEWVNENEKKT